MDVAAQLFGPAFVPSYASADDDGAVGVEVGGICGRENVEDVAENAVDVGLPVARRGFALGFQQRKIGRAKEFAQGAVMARDGRDAGLGP